MAQSPRRLVILLVALLGTFVIVRAGMLLRPDADLFVAGFNIHHLFTGVLVVTISVIPLVVGTPKPPPRTCWWVDLASDSRSPWMKSCIAIATLRFTHGSKTPGEPG